MYPRTSFIYKHETSTLTTIVTPRDILNLAIHNIFYIQSYVESAFTYNPVSTALIRPLWSNGLPTHSSLQSEKISTACAEKLLRNDCLFLKIRILQKLIPIYKIGTKLWQIDNIFFVCCIAAVFSLWKFCVCVC